MSKEAAIVIIGAGVVGLAIAAEVSRIYKHVFVFEKKRSFGLESSSHNSEVIHAGMYYPENSLKANLCVNGNRLLYELCKKYGINYKRLGKLIVAADDTETKETVREWLNSREGYEFVKDELRGALKPYSRQGGIDMEIEDITLKETEVRGTDTDPRV